MFELEGKFATAKIFTDNCDDTTQSQIVNLCNQSFIESSKVRIMPDCHAGAGCVIGTTMTLTDKVVPNLVGVDIGCGMHVTKLADKRIDFAHLDEVIRKFVPSGFAIRDKVHDYANLVDFRNIKATINLNRAKHSVGTLGGGNHFIEVNIDDEENYYLVIHSGSRNMGKQIAEFWQDVATKTLEMNYDSARKIVLVKYKESEQYELIQSEQEKIEKPPHKSLSYLTDDNLEMYLNDMKIAQEYANLNRFAMASVILQEMKFHKTDNFTTIHNYIDMDTKILRKGAVSAKLGEELIIPINMRDGSILAKGLGNPDWNFSAPHGAGRLMGRGEAKRNLNMEEYKNSMEGIFTTSVNTSTLDEAPMAYKDMNEIIENTKDTITVDKIIKPVYNFKASGD
jgi:tRNA-splicing ligase RtcB